MSTTQRPALFFDFDDSLVQTTPVIRQYIFETYSVRLPDGYVCGHSLDAIVQERLPRGAHFDRAQFWKRQRTEFQQSKKWMRKLKPVEDAPEVIQYLTKTYELWLVTARDKQGLTLIGDTLDMLYPEAFTGIHCVYHNHRDGKYTKEPKHAFMERFHRDHRIGFIDDHPQEIKDASHAVTSYLFDPNHWHDNESDITHRVHSWAEIADTLL